MSKLKAHIPKPYLYTHLKKIIGCKMIDLRYGFTIQDLTFNIVPSPNYQSSPPSDNEVIKRKK